MLQLGVGQEAQIYLLDFDDAWTTSKNGEDEKQSEWIIGWKAKEAAEKIRHSNRKKEEEEQEWEDRRKKTKFFTDIKLTIN